MEAFETVVDTVYRVKQQAIQDPVATCQEKA
jgi:hypothetical protein